MMKLIRLPREHGAYVVLGASWLAGLLRSPQIDPLGLFLFLGFALGALLAQHPLKLLSQGKLRFSSATERRRSTLAIFGICAATLLCGAGVAIRHPAILWLLPPAAIVAGLYLRLDRRRAPVRYRSLVGFLGLTLAAPAALISAAGDWVPVEAAGLWLTAALFFCGAVYCVDIRLSGARAVRPAILYHTGALALVALLAWGNILETWALLVVALAIVRLLWIIGDVERYRMMPLKRIGILESVVAAGFIVVVVSS